MASGRTRRRLARAVPAVTDAGPQPCGTPSPPRGQMAQACPDCMAGPRDARAHWCFFSAYSVVLRAALNVSGNDTLEERLTLEYDQLLDFFTSYFILLWGVPSFPLMFRQVGPGRRLGEKRSQVLTVLESSLSPPACP